MSLDILISLEKIWENRVKQRIKEDNRSGVRAFWSEADLVHFVATYLQDSLHKEVNKNLIIHVSSSLIPDLFIDPLAQKLDKLIHE